MRATLGKISTYNKAKKLALAVLLLSPCLLVPVSLSGQQKTFHQDDVWSVFVKKSKRAARDSAATKPPVLKKPYFSTTPYVGYNPAYGALIGVSSTAGIYFGKPSTTPISSAVVALNITTKSQVIFNLRTNFFSDNARFILRGDWRYMLFSQSTFGLGTGMKHQREGGIILNDGGQTYPIQPDEEPIEYNYVRLYESFYLKITDKIYAGIGYSLDQYWDIDDTKLDPDSLEENPTFHYSYCQDHGFDTARYTVSGISLEFLMDSRNSTIRPTRGLFANIAFRPNFTWLGSSKNSWMLNTEFRAYKNVQKERPDHLVGFWYIGQFTQNGKVPYLGLPAIAWDMYNRTGRGYIQGSIRGVNFMYGEVEYRFPISRYTGILGGVLFFNVTTASSDDGEIHLFEFFDPAGGAGLRIMFNRTTLSNLTIDLGMGRDRKLGIYFSLNETF